MSFSFGFSGDDIEPGDEETHDVVSALQEEGVSGTTSGTSQPLIEPRLHSLQELLDSLPSKISYSTLKITTSNGRDYQIPRRELFDVRLQLMAEDDGRNESVTGNSHALTDLGNDDIQTNVYEGGLKSWECSVDLARLLLEEPDRIHRTEDNGLTHIVELGAGTALPALAVFHSALLQDWSSPMHFTLSDYNIDVLRLVTIPNLLLSWAYLTILETTGVPWNMESDLDITSDLLESFARDLQKRGVAVDGISGAWGRPLADMVGMVCKPERRLVLASETIYSPASLASFTDVTMASLEGVPGAAALVAAKRVYFGVGGGVDEFLRELEGRGGRATQVAEDTTAGVSRVILEVTQRTSAAQT